MKLLSSTRRTLQSGAFKYSGYRYLWVSQLFNSTALWMDQVAIGWLVLEMTNSPLMVGIVSAARLVPFFLVGIPSGALSDRVSRHLLLRFTSGASTVLTLITAILISLQVIQVWHLLILTTLGGALRATNLTVRASFIYDVVGPEDALNGIALSAGSQRLGGLIGGPAAGFLIGFVGTDGAYYAMTVTYLVATVVLFFITSSGQVAVKTRETFRESILGAVHLIASNRTVATIMLITAAVEVFGFSHQTLMPVFARDVFGIGSEGFGVMMAFRAVGGIAGTFGVAMLGNFRKKGWLLIIAMSVFGLGLMALAGSQAFVVALVLIAIANFGAGVAGVLEQTLIQGVVPDKERGRAMGAMSLSVGLAPLGHLESGATADFWGARIAMLINGGALAILAAAAALWTPRIRRLE